MILYAVFSFLIFAFLVVEEDIAKPLHIKLLAAWGFPVVLSFIIIRKIIR